MEEEEEEDAEKTNNQVPEVEAMVLGSASSDTDSGSQEGWGLGEPLVLFVRWDIGSYCYLEEDDDFDFDFDFDFGTQMMMMMRIWW